MEVWRKWVRYWLALMGAFSGAVGRFFGGRFGGVAAVVVELAAVASGGSAGLMVGGWG